MAIAVLVLWVTTLWAWLDFGTDYCGGLAASLGHGSLALEQPDGTYTWGSGVGGPDFPSHAWSAGGGEGKREVVYASVTFLNDLPGYALVDRLANMRWRPSAGSVASLMGSGRRWYLDMPLWIPGVLAGSIAVLAWRRKLRRRTQAELAACTSCGYDLRGIGAGRPCPECGCATPFAATA